MQSAQNLLGRPASTSIESFTVEIGPPGPFRQPVFFVHVWCGVSKVDISLFAKLFERYADEFSSSIIHDLLQLTTG